MKKQLKIERWVFGLLPLTGFVFLISNMFLLIVGFIAIIPSDGSFINSLQLLLNESNEKVLRWMFVISFICFFHIMYCTILSWYNLRTAIVNEHKLKHLYQYKQAYLKMKQSYEDAIKEIVENKVFKNHG